MAGEALNGLPQQTADERKALLAAVAQYGDAGRQQFEAAQQSIAQSKQAALAGALVGGNPMLDAQIAERVASPFDRATSAIGVSQANHQSLLDTIGARGAESISNLGAAVPLAQAYLQKQFDLQQQLAAAKAAEANKPSYTERADQVAAMSPDLLAAAQARNFGAGTGAILGRAMGTAADRSALAGALGSTPPPQVPGGHVAANMGGGFFSGTGSLDSRSGALGSDVDKGGVHATITPPPSQLPPGSGPAGAGAVLGSLLSPTGPSSQGPQPQSLASIILGAPAGRAGEVSRLSKQVAADEAAPAYADPAAGNPNFLRDLARQIGGERGIDPGLLYKALPNLTDPQLASQQRAQTALGSDADAKALAGKAGLSEAKVREFQSDPDYQTAVQHIQDFISDPANSGFTNDDFMAFIRSNSKDPEFTKLLLAVFGHPFTANPAPNYKPPAG